MTSPVLLRRTRALRPVGGVLLTGAALATALTACSTSEPSTAPATSSFPTSASVTVPAGAAARTTPGATLDFGATAVLPANAFAPAGATAMYTVTGISPGTGVPDDATQGGKAYFIYLTVTALSVKPAVAPTVVGFAGSTDGRTPALTLPPSVPLTACANPEPPEKMKRGESYATCLVAYADPDQELGSVIYWADTTGDASYDFKSDPVVWGTPTPVSSASATPSSPAPAG
ncbi:hypothetical protein [Gordonia desulfuricans]|uniref:hypothetical protein n=1 Tax=Gordonia desulfuricans TaxID=89051 RepID=UPI001FD3977F|nr:hypothetical protein [Gordonia desulfuricans]